MTRSITLHNRRPYFKIGPIRFPRLHRLLARAAPTCTLWRHHHVFQFYILRLGPRWVILDEDVESSR